MHVEYVLLFYAVFHMCSENNNCLFLHLYLMFVKCVFQNQWVLYGIVVSAMDFVSDIEI